MKLKKRKLMHLEMGKHDLAYRHHHHVDFPASNTVERLILDRHLISLINDLKACYAIRWAAADGI